MIGVVTVVIAREPAGFRVMVEPTVRGRDHGMAFHDLEYAHAYARGLAAGGGWAVDDRTADVLVVQQLNHAQWHVIDPVGLCGSSVSGWVDAVSTALWAACLTGRGVETIDLDYDRLTLLRVGCAK